MSDHRHEAYEVYNAATVGDTQELRSYIDGLRQDLGFAEERIRELENELSSLRHEVRELAAAVSS